MFPLEIEAAETRRFGKRLVGPITLRLEGDGICVLLGPNGAGKTSFLRLLHGIARLSAGSIRWACPAEEAHHAQAFVFQRPVMLRRSVAENLVYPLRIGGMGRKAALLAIEPWAERAGLTAMLGRPATALSAGEQQKLSLIRALIARPSLVFLDEPCASLDGRATREIEAILTEARAEGTRFIMATHDLGQARRLADRVIFLLAGGLHETGPAAQFFEEPQTDAARAFLRGDIVE